MLKTILLSIIFIGLLILVIPFDKVRKIFSKKVKNSDEEIKENNEK